MNRRSDHRILSLSHTVISIVARSTTVCACVSPEEFVAGESGVSGEVQLWRDDDLVERLGKL